MTRVECLGDDVVLRFAQGQLPDDSAADAQVHVSECEDCRHLVAEAARYLSDHPASRSLGSSLTLPAAEASPAPLAGGQRVGRYELLDVIGAGGMGVVYTAFDPQLSRKVALKLVRASSSNVEVAAKSRARLLREAQSMAQLQHPNVVAVFDAGTHEGQVFVAMELVQGLTLKAWLKQQQLGWRGVVDTFLAAGEGLAAAHTAGLVHRDFKPENVLVGLDGRVRVTDFGLARLESASGAEEHRPLPRTASGRPASVTETGMLLGTPAYMAPEQLRGETVDARSDQFSFCVALFEALYGHRPYALTSLSEERIAFPKGVPAALVRVLERGLQQTAAHRFSSMREVLGELRRAGEPAMGRRWAAGVAAALVTVSVAVTAVLLFPREPAAATGVAPATPSGVPAAVPAPPRVVEPEPIVPAPLPAAVDPAPEPARRAPARASRSNKTAKPAPRKNEPAVETDDAPIQNPWGKGQ